VKKSLERLDGVTVENVAVGSATVAYDPAVSSTARITDAISHAGYPAAVARQEA